MSSGGQVVICARPSNDGLRGASSTLDRNRVEYIVVGGTAALAHGSARLTQDLDVVYSRTPENLDRLA